MKTRKPFKARLSKPTTAKLIAEGGPVTIKAGADEGDKKGPPTFEGVGYSGGVVPRQTLNIKLDADYIIDLSGFTPGRNVKANLDHKNNQRVGHLTAVENDKKQVAVAGVLSAATAHRDEVANSSTDQYGWEVSIEADLESPKKLDVGKTAIVNGRNVTGPLYIFRKSTLTGLGFVSNGADAGNNVSIAASAAGAKQMDEFELFAASLGADLESATDGQKAALQKAFDAQQGSGTAVKTRQTLSQIAEDVRKEEARQDNITAVCLSAMKEHPMYIQQIEELGKLAIEKKSTPDQFELELIRATRSRAGTFSSRMTEKSHADPEVIQAAICMASGLPNIEKVFSQQTLEAVDRADMRNNFSLQQLLLQVAHDNGYACRAGERIHPRNIRTVLEYCFPPVHARLQQWSTVSLPNILGSVANKQILAGYMEEDRSWEEIAEVKPVNNFYQQNHYRMLDNLEYEEVGSGGEIKHGTLGEETYTSQAKTYGKMLAITRTQIINDDLGAFDDIRTRLGKGALQKFNNVFWAAFMNNASHFTTARTNYIDGATSNLGVNGVGLEQAVTAYRKMRSPSADGTKRVGANASRPTIVLVPPEGEFIADRLYVSGNLNTGGAATDASVPNENIHFRKYRPVVQNRLSDSSFTGYSTTAFYLLGGKPMLVTFLNGNRTPIVESTDADFNVLGIQFRGYHDFGAGLGEYLVGIKSKGAAA